MFEIEDKGLKISEELNRKIEKICRFACCKYEFIPGDIKSVKNTNIAYVKPHVLNDYFIFENSNIVFKNGYNGKIRITGIYAKVLTLDQARKNFSLLEQTQVPLKEIKNDLTNNYQRINKLENQNEELQEELDEKDTLLENARTKIK